MSNNLKYGQIISIKNEKYTVIGMIEFKEDTWVWQEYKIKNQKSDIKWLSVEENEGKVQYSLYTEKPSIRISESLEFNYENEKYSLYEQGTAIVKRFYGNVDVDSFEKVEFKEYINETKTKLISSENWSGEVEKSTGIYLNETDILITQEINNSLPKKQNKANVRVIAYMTLIFVAFFGLIGAVISISSSNVISKFLEKSSDFEYVTSVTNNVNNKKAKVYKTNLSIDEAVKKIIDAAPEAIKEVKEDDESDGVGLLTSKEYAYVYTGEDNQVYVQIAKNSFMTEDTNSYNSKYRSRGYYRTYRRTSTSSNYSSYLNSARQQSINSRKSSGGGTSSGK